MLSKLGGTWAPRPSAGPHKLRESLPLSIFLKNRLKYALTSREVTQIVAQRLIKVDGKVRTDTTYPCGFMDVISIEKSGENFRLLYDVKGRFTIHRITAEEAQYKLAKVKRVQLGPRGVPYLVTHDGRTIRYPDPAIKANDTVRLSLPTKLTDSETPKATGVAPHGVAPSPKIESFIRFEPGNLVMCTGGRNMGRAGILLSKERHLGGFDIAHVRDGMDREFTTRLNNIFTIGEGNKSWVSLPKGKGIKLSITEERDQRRKQREAATA